MGNIVPTSLPTIPRNQTQSTFIGIYGGKIPHNKPSIVRNGLISKPIRPVGTGTGTIKSNIKRKTLTKHKKCKKMQ